MPAAINAAEWWLTYQAREVICCSRFMAREVIRDEPAMAVANVVVSVVTCLAAVWLGRTAVSLVWR